MDSSYNHPNPRTPFPGNSNPQGVLWLPEVGEGSHLSGRGQEGGERPTVWYIGILASTQVFHHTMRKSVLVACKGREVQADTGKLALVSCEPCCIMGQIHAGQQQGKTHLLKGIKGHYLPIPVESQQGEATGFAPWNLERISLRN